MNKDYAIKSDYFKPLNSTYYAKNYEAIDRAWDLFSDYIGEKSLKIPLSVFEFENIFEEIVTDSKVKELKFDILKSFRYDSYSWPLVERIDEN